MDNNTLRYEMELNSYMGDLSIASLQMGNYEEWFPDCGFSLSDCSSYPFSTYSTNSILSSQETNNSEDVSSNVGTNSNWKIGTFDLILIIAAVIVFIMIIVISILIITIIMKRRNSFTLPQPIQFED